MNLGQHRSQSCLLGLEKHVGYPKLWFTASIIGVYRQKLKLKAIKPNEKRGKKTQAMAWDKYGSNGLSSSWRCSENKFVSFGSFRQSRQKWTEPSRAAVKHFFVSWMEAGIKYCHLCHKCRFLTLLEQLSARNIIWQPQSSAFSQPW